MVTGLSTDSETEAFRPTEKNPPLDQPKGQADGINDDTQSSGGSSPAKVTKEEKLSEDSWNEGLPPSCREEEGSPSRRVASPMDINNEDPSSNSAQRFYVYRDESQCTQPDLPSLQNRDIPNSSRGNYLFFSLIKIIQLNTSPCEIRAKLPASPALASCGDPLEACRILSDVNEYADADCLYTFSKEYKQNLCVHFHADNRLIILHYRSNENPEFIHLHLVGLHYTPYFPAIENTPKQLERNIYLNI